MRIGSRFSMPYPVLGEETADFPDGSFQFEISYEETKQTGSVDISCVPKISEPAIEALLESGSARLGMFVDCRTTYVSQLRDLDKGGGTVNFGGGELKDRVDIRPIVYTKANCVVESDRIHKEFGEQNWQYEAGQFPLLGPLYSFDVGLEKLAAFETIFQLQRNDEVNEGEIRVSVESDRVGIALHSKTFEKVHNLRSNHVGQVIMINSLYFPVIMDIFNTLKAPPGGIDQFRWYRVFAAKCSVLGIDPSSGDPFENAQKILKIPLNRLVDLKELSL